MLMMIINVNNMFRAEIIREITTSTFKPIYAD